MAGQAWEDRREEDWELADRKVADQAWEDRRVENWDFLDRKVADQTLTTSAECRVLIHVSEDHHHPALLRRNSESLD